MSKVRVSLHTAQGVQSERDYTRLRFTEATTELHLRWSPRIPRTEVARHHPDFSSIMSVLCGKFAWRSANARKETNRAKHLVSSQLGNAKAKPRLRAKRKRSKVGNT